MASIKGKINSVDSFLEYVDKLKEFWLEHKYINASANDKRSLDQNAAIRICYKQIKENNEGLLAIDNADNGSFTNALLHSDESFIEQTCEKWTSLFPDRYYLELQRIGLKGQNNHINKAIELASHKTYTIFFKRIFSYILFYAE